MTKFVLTLLLVGMTAMCSFGQEGPPQEPPPAAIGPGDHTRTIMLGEQKRTYLFHVPKDYDPKKPVPVVLALHGALMNGSMMVWFSGLNKKSNEAGFIVIYPSGTGTGPFLTWNAGGFRGKMAEVVLVVIEEGGHTWPGQQPPVGFIGKSVKNVSANDLMWEFFQKHPMK